MSPTIRLLIAAAAVTALSGCAVARTTGKVVSAPVKGAYHVTKFAGKTVYGTGKVVGKGLIATGKGVYYIGSVPVKITDAALDTSIKVLTVTTQMVDLTGSVVTTSRQISAAQLDAELAMIKRSKNILSVIVDAA